MKRFKEVLETRTELLVTIIVSIFFLVGLIGHILQTTRLLMLSFSPYFLFLFGLFAIFPILRKSSWKMRIWMAATLLITFGLEAVGTATGHIFGPYTYGPTLGPALFDVPVVISFNWLLVILGAHTLSKQIFDNNIVSALATGAFALLFDFILEPVAINLDYWYWHTGHIPLQNYAAWFMIASVFAYAFNLFKLEVKHLRVRNYVLIQLVFFVGLRIFLK
jgi:putative membrane protein